MHVLQKQSDIIEMKLEMLEHFNFIDFMSN